MMVMWKVILPVEDMLSADAGVIDRVIREGCPFFVGIERLHLYHLNLHPKRYPKDVPELEILVGGFADYVHVSCAELVE